MSTKTKRALSLLRSSLLTALGLTGLACNSYVGECGSPKIDTKTQLTACSEGYSHRAQTVRCEPTSDNAPETQDCGGQDCSELAHGYCDPGTGPLMLQCRSGCSEDADCESGFICACGSSLSPTGGVCLRSNCTTDADCGGDSLCASAQETCGGSRFACQDDDDECMTDSDCDDASCAIDNDGHRYCFTAVCGRPFLVESAQRVAPTTENRDWQLASQPRVDHLTSTERSSLAAHWTRLGQMEHASIAAFARFSLQLLSLGAPPELVEACTAALADETAHTKLCFGIASAYAGRAIGPGPLDISGSLTVTSLEDIVDLVIAEGCFGETSAALEALQAADAAADPIIRAAYAQIAKDEQRHAELAFRFVRWALQQGGARAADRIAAAIAVPPSSDASAAAVSVPCLRALLDSVTPPALAAARDPKDRRAT